MEQKARAGDSDRITREYFDSLLIEMRHIDAVIPDTGLIMFGEKFSTPIMTAALSHLNNCHEDGMVELAKGAKAADAVMWAGMGDEAELERITATGARTVKIIKPYADNSIIFNKIAHAIACGCMAAGMDIDHSFNSRGEYDVVLGQPMSSKSFDEIKRFISASKLPYIIKGVMSAQDAMKSVEAGAGGIVVSHHHGIMDYSKPPLMALPEILRVVDGKIPVFVDCGIGSGMDVFKALALGASAVCVGRALMDPLKEAGAAGAEQAIRDMTKQLAGVMARTCSPDIRHIDPSVVWFQNAARR